jgi:hypothetical protein
MPENPKEEGPMQANGNGSRLAKVQKGRLKTPLRYVFYGDEGVGKTTLAAAAPDPLLFDIEDGSGRLDISRYSFRDEPGGHVPGSYKEILGGIDDLIANPSPFKTLVLDTADRLESLMWRNMLERDSGKTSAMNKSGKTFNSIEEYGYGKGYVMALDEWRSLCAKLDRLRVSRGMAIIWLAHASIRTFKNPEGDDYDRYQLRINDKAAGFLKEWADVTGFACFEEGAGKLDGDAARPKGFSTGRRLLRLERTAAFDAKTRISLPAQVPLDPMNPWAPLAKAVEDGLDQDITWLKAQIDEEVRRLADVQLADKVKAAVTAAGEDREALSRYMYDLRRRQPRVAA